jgi:hypothetical protein
MPEHSEEEINLNILMENALQPNNSGIIFLTKVKFRNIVYSPGDDVVLIGK